MSQKYWWKIVDDYSAMKWPCPEGFHVPLNTEWIAVHDVWKALGWWASDWTNFGIALKLPFAGLRRYSSADVDRQGDYWNYWSSSYYSLSNDGYAYSLRLYLDIISPNNSYRSFGYSIRWFKDSPIIPTLSWTKLYWTSIESWWIFWSSTDWLISLSSNWSNWITIADKNLWATAVWNSWDTLSETNCGKYYQWGNNYWFQWSWTLPNISSTQVDASDYWPWNYYSSDTFIMVNSSNWDTSNNRDLRWWVTWVQQRPANIIKKYYWGKLLNDYSAMRWPCQDGFHVPSKDEWTALHGILTNTFWLASNGTTMKTYLKMPYNGERFWYSWDVGYSWGNYWSCSASSAGYAFFLSFYSSDIYTNGSYMRAYWHGIRWFKDEPVIPDSNWTTLYDWSSVAIWAGIFHNATLGVISVSADWQNWTTIADKNLWATTVYNDWDTLSEANCWYFYQWWNNYNFPFRWTITTSSSQVDASNYWPWNYYNSSTFIFRSSNESDKDWSNPGNDNLRWWVTWVQQRPAKVKKVYYWWKLVDDYSAMRWPCPDGFHVPTSTEFSNVNVIWKTLWAWNGSWHANLTTYLLLPYYKTEQNKTWGYWCCNRYWSQSLYPASSSTITFGAYIGIEVPRPDTRSSLNWIRPFKDTPVIPDNSWATLYDWSSTATWAWIFHNSALWLISLSSDWNIRYTISDKNLWATIVWNSWDTINEYNYGKRYQWWNNYWFPWAWSSETIDTSSTQVDASNYWPWNYYSSSTYITWNDDWSSVMNDNLRWWVTGVQQRPVLIREYNS